MAGCWGAGAQRWAWRWRLHSGGFGPGLTREDQELSLSSWTLSLELDQSASVPQACFCSCFHLQTGGATRRSVPTCALPGSFPAPSPCTAGLCLHQEPQEARPCHPPRWLKNCPLFHPRVFGCQEGDLSLSNARVWINLSPSHSEGEGAISVCPSREIFAAEEAKGVAYCLPPSTQCSLSCS